MAKASENVFPKVQFSEETAPATPSAGQAVVYVKTDGKLYLKDDAGTETDLTASGGGATFSGARVTHSTTQSISNTTDTALSFDGETFDTDSFHDNATNNSRLTIPSTDYYELTAQVQFAANGSGNRRNVALRINGTTVIARVTTYPTGANSHRAQCVLGAYSFTASDYVEVVVFQDSGGALNVESTETFFSVKAV